MNLENRTPDPTRGGRGRGMRKTGPIPQMATWHSGHRFLNSALLPCHLSLLASPLSPPHPPLSASFSILTVTVIPTLRYMTFHTYSCFKAQLRCHLFCAFLDTILALCLAHRRCSINNCKSLQKIDPPSSQT